MLSLMQLASLNPDQIQLCLSTGRSRWFRWCCWEWSSCLLVPLLVEWPTGDNPLSPPSIHTLLSIFHPHSTSNLHLPITPIVGHWEERILRDRRESRDTNSLLANDRLDFTIVVGFSSHVVFASSPLNESTYPLSTPNPSRFYQSHLTPSPYPPYSHSPPSSTPAAPHHHN